MSKKSIKATEYDEKFDNSEDISDYLDIEHAQRPGQEQKRDTNNSLASGSQSPDWEPAWTKSLI